MFSAVDIIRKKRDGERLSREEIRWFIEGYTRGDIPDYQAAALAMAIYFQGMDGEETAWLAQTMAQSGEILDLSGIKGIKVDKHSTGGVGDKTTLTVGPVVATAGVPVAKMSGRGLGHTGGTIDKFASIPGFKVNLDRSSFIDQVNRIGIAVVAQSGNLVPADKKLYALRDVTATVESVPLIASSVMSKKLAAGADAILLDVKVGSGAFMKTLPEAAHLARIMVDIGKRAGKKVVAVLTDMGQPLGQAVGNAVEVREALQLLKGEGPQDLYEITVFLAGYMIYLGEKAATPEAGQAIARGLIESGVALDKFREMVRAQGGNWPLDEEISLPEAPVNIPVYAEKKGYIASLDTEGIGRAAMHLGAGREKLDDDIDPAAGITVLKKPGDQVIPGQELVVLHTGSEEKARSVALGINSLYLITDSPPVKKPLILDVIS